jgi:hypothetical protein
LKLLKLNNKIDISDYNQITDCLDSVEQRLNTSRSKAGRGLEFYIDKNAILEEFETNDFSDIARALAQKDFESVVGFSTSDQESYLGRIKIDSELARKMIFEIGPSLLGYSFKRGFEIQGQDIPPTLSWGIKGDKLHYQFHNGSNPIAFLVFEIPHNVAHFIHLDQQSQSLPLTYINSMKQRAFFKSVAVYAKKTAKWFS